MFVKNSITSNSGCFKLEAVNTTEPAVLCLIQGCHFNEKIVLYLFNDIQAQTKPLGRDQNFKVHGLF